MSWVYLCLAIVFEVIGTTSMKFSEGFTKLVPSIALVIGYLASFSFLTLALKGLEISTAYAVWSGVGIVFITIIGFMFFQEQMSIAKAISILLIIIGVVTLNLTGK